MPEFITVLQVLYHLRADEDRRFLGCPGRAARDLTGCPQNERLDPQSKWVAMRAAELLDLNGTLDRAIAVEEARRARSDLETRMEKQARALRNVVALARAGALVGGVRRAVERKAEAILAANPSPSTREIVETALWGVRTEVAAL